MDSTENEIRLEKNEQFVPETAGDAFLVREGTAAVYIAPLAENGFGRKIILCEVGAGQAIPAFVHRDRNYRRWRFIITARTDLALRRLPGCATSVLLEKFAGRAGLKNYAEEGFENSLAEFYEREAVKDEVFIERGRQQEPKLREAACEVILDAFRGGEAAAVSGSGPYKALVRVFQALKLGRERLDKAAGQCGEHAQLQELAAAAGLICREVVLEADWYKHDCGILVGTAGEETVVCVPDAFGYRLVYAADGRKVRVSRRIAGTVEPKAHAVSRTLPAGALKKKDIASFLRKELSGSDLTALFLLGLAGGLVGILLPILEQKAFDELIPWGNCSGLWQACFLAAACAAGNLLFSIVRSLCGFRLRSRAGYRLQAAAYYRLFRLPESFFSKYDTADLAQRVMLIGPTADRLLSLVLITGISSIFSVLYLAVMFVYSGTLAWISLLMVLVYVGLLIPLTVSQAKKETEIADRQGEADAKLYQYLGGLEKIRMAGVEDRAVYEYMVPFSSIQEKTIRKNRVSAIAAALTGVSSAVFSMVLYYAVIRSEQSISVGAFIAFGTAFGSFASAAEKLVRDLLAACMLRTSCGRFMPIFETACEDDGESLLPGKLAGNISLQHVTFSYAGDKTPVLEDISLDIHKGEYLGIVGPSGCGKSTLVRLLLGYEVPDSGQILYDGQDLRQLNKRALRRSLGTVLQNGKLIAGSIYENITITAPDAEMSDVMRVIEAVGLKDDIAAMPMGVHTVLSEDGGTISGGQKQRILIARAIIREPPILIFDEATSALDNLTQAAVCESLEKMHVTRIAAAHRLSTIRSCDRIIVMDRGRIAETGNYESLLAGKGLFYRLAGRQTAE